MPLAESAQDGGGIRSASRYLEGEREARLSESEPGEKLSMKAEGFAGVSLDLDVRFFELLDERDRVLPFERDSAADGESQIPREALFELSFRLQVAQRDVASESHESLALDARAGRVAVDDSREDVEPVPLPFHPKGDSRPFANHSGKLARANFDRNPSLERRQDAPHELSDFLGSVDPAMAQLLPLPSGQLGLDLGPQASRRERDSVSEPLLHVATLAETKDEPASLGVVDDEGTDDGLGGSANGSAVESDVPRTGESPEHSSRRPLVDHPPIISPERLLDLDVFGRGFERSVRESGERKLDWLETGLDLDSPLESDPLAGTGEPILQGTFPGLRLNSLAPGDDHGGDVLAGIEGAPAVAFPVGVLWKKRNPRGQGGAGKRDPRDDLLTVVGLDRDRALAGEGDTF
jgi:hypothetical protein